MDTPAPSPQQRYGIPVSPVTFRVEAFFASGEEPWTRRAVAALDAAFGDNPDGLRRLRETCQRLERAFRKGASRGAASNLDLDLILEAHGVPEDERADWRAYGEAYARAREPAYRALTVQLARPAPPAPNAQ